MPFKFIELFENILKMPEKKEPNYFFIIKTFKNLIKKKKIKVFFVNINLFGWKYLKTF